MKRLDYHQIKSLGTINCFDSYIADKYYDLIRDDGIYYQMNVQNIFGMLQNYM